MSQQNSQAAPLIFPDAGAIGHPGPRVRHQTRSRNGTAMGALVVLLAIGGLFTFLDLADETAPLMAPLPLDIICLAVGLVPGAVSAATRRRFDLLEPIHLIIASFTLITGVRALYLITYRTAVYTRIPSDDLISAALALSIVGMLAVYAGYYSGIGDNLAASIRPWRALWVGEFRYPPTIIAVAAFIGLTGMIVLGGEAASVEGQRSVLDSAGLFWLMPLSYCAPFALYMMFLNLEHEPPSAARAIAFATILGTIAAFFLLRPSKDWILRLFYYPLVFYHYRRRKLRPFKSVAIGTVVVITIFTWGVIGNLYVKRFGYDSADTIDYLSKNVQNPREFFDLLLSRFYGIDSIAVIIEHVRQTGHFLMGSSLAEALYWFVPRALWPGKPYTFSYAFGRLFQGYVGWGGDSFATTTVFGELYLNFGIVGVVAGSFIFGVFARTVYAYLIGRVQTKSAIMLYSIFLIQLVEFTEGPIGAHVALMSSEIAPFVMLLYVTWAAGSFGRREPAFRRSP
jgi:oligosaccharide repeat unit polymerase